MSYNQIIVFSGAGISAESGVSTFRDKEGLWENYKIEDVCEISTWEANYNLVHEFYDQRREKLGTVFPNLAHSMVSYWQKKYIKTAFVNNITTNVDDLFERAGVVGTTHLHGYIPEVTCGICGKTTDIGYNPVYRVDEHSGEPYLNNTLYSEHFSCMKKRQNIFKPNVVFFGEMAPKYSVLNTAVQSCDDRTIVVIVGCSNQVVDFLRLVKDKKSKVFLIDPNPKITYSFNDLFVVENKATDGMLIVNDMIKDLI